MDFFDSVLDKAKEAIEIVSKKTEEVVATQKQKYNIAALKNKRAKNLERLGEIYFEQLIESEIEDAETEELVSSIADQNEKIAELEQEL